MPQDLEQNVPQTGRGSRRRKELYLPLERRRKSKRLHGGGGQGFSRHKVVGLAWREVSPGVKEGLAAWRMEKGRAHGLIYKGCKAQEASRQGQGKERPSRQLRGLAFLRPVTRTMDGMASSQKNHSFLVLWV